jgi:nucleotide-binding universal stress UspA family protein
MSIICGTDFSEMAAHAATVAGCLAARTGQVLHLVHALDLGAEEVREQPGHPLVLWAESRLAREADRLKVIGADVHTHVVAGPAEAVLQASAREKEASLIVVGAIGHRNNPPRRLGTRANRTALQSQLPVLTVRDAAAFMTWFNEGRPLRVVMGVDGSQSSRDAARWLDELCRAGAVDLVLAHLYWPPEAFHRLGLEGIRSFVDPDPQVVQSLEQQLSHRLDGLLHAKVRVYRIEPHLGRLGDGLAALAAEERADLLVVGCHPQSPLERLWEGSIAGQALHAARMSVACVPALGTARERHTPRLRHVLAATDFSDLANSAIPLAYAAASEGGTVHLVHVVKEGRPGVDPYDVFHPAPNETTSEAVVAARARLSDLIPSDASAKGIASEVHAVEASEPWQAIVQVAERLDVDLICLGTHGRSGLAKVVLGSIAAHVLTNSRRPLLLARGSKP